MPPEALTLFLDRSLGKQKVAGALRAAGAEVQVHDSLFPIGTRDDEWLHEVGGRGWVVLHKDKHIRRRATELEALKKAKIAAFVLTSGNLTGDEMAIAFVKALKKIHRMARHQPRPFIAAVSRDGRVSLLFSAKDLNRKS
jgi:hypothetical protein